MPGNKLHSLGVILVALSAVAWSTAGVFAKGVTAEVWSILFWRGLFSAGFILVYVLWREGSATAQRFRQLGGPGWAVATIGSIATVAFISAFKFTAIANVVIVYATAPFVAAAIAWLWMRERAGRSTLVASAVALVGVVIVVGGSVGAPSLTGDLLAMVMTFGMAAMMVVIRRNPGAPMVVAGCVSSLQMMLVGWLAADPFAVSTGEIWALIVFGLVQAMGIVLLTEGARLIPASESGLLGSLEIPLAPLWAWLVLTEIPPRETAVGGVIVAAAVAWHVWRGDRPTGR